MGGKQGKGKSSREHGGQVRHIKYGARPEDVEPFAAAFMEALSRIMADRWDEKSAKVEPTHSRTHLRTQRGRT